jgi:hypothetical protein
MKAAAARDVHASLQEQACDEYSGDTFGGGCDELADSNTMGVACIH